MSNACPVTGEWREARLAWREEFVNSYLCQRAGLILVGAPTFNRGIVLDGATQYASYEGERCRNIFSATSLYLFIRFTPDFAYDDGADHYFLDSGPNNRLRLIKTAGDDLELRVGGTLIATIVPGTYAAWWQTDQENVLTISYASGDSDAWLNGVPILIADPSAWTPKLDEETLYIGADDAGADHFDGTIHEVLIGIASVDENEDEDYREGVTVSELDEALSVITIPCIGSYVRAVDSRRVTPAIGVGGVSEVRMGSDGTTIAEFPAALFPRGFSFDGGDQLYVGDEDVFTFASGGADEPFSAAGLLNMAMPAAAVVWFEKAGNSTQGEYYGFIGANGRFQCRCVDDSEGGFRGRRSAIGAAPFGSNLGLLRLYDGSGSPEAAGSTVLFMNSSDVTDSATSSGNYTSMENTGRVLVVGNAVAGAGGGFIGRQYLFNLYDFMLTSIQSRVMTDRMRRQAQSS